MILALQYLYHCNMYCSHSWTSLYLLISMQIPTQFPGSKLLFNLLSVTESTRIVGLPSQIDNIVCNNASLA